MCDTDLSNITLNAKSESSDLLYSYASSDSVLNNNNVEFMSTSSNAQEPLQHIFVPPPMSLNILGITRYSTVLCNYSTIVEESILQETVLLQRTDNLVRGFGDGSGSSGDEISSNENKIVYHHHSSNPQHPLQNSSRYKLQSTAVNTSLTPQTFAGGSYINSKHPEGNTREAVGSKPSVGMNFMLPKSQSVYTNTGDYLIGDGLTERGPILIDIPTTQIAAHSS